MISATHFFDNQVRKQTIQIGLAAPGGSSGTNVAIDIKPGAKNWRIAYAPRNLPGKSACGRNPADFSPPVHAVTVDRAVVIVFVDQAFLNHVAPGLRACLETFFWIGIVTRIDAAFPVQPQLQ